MSPSSSVAITLILLHPFWAAGLHIGLSRSLGPILGSDIFFTACLQVPTISGRFRDSRADTPSSLAVAGLHVAYCGQGFHYQKLKFIGHHE
jgi:hypothetical protein